MSTIEQTRPTSLEQRHDDARAAAAEGRTDEAAAILRRLVRDRPELVVLRRNLVRVLAGAGRDWEAVDACRSALIDHPDDRPLAELLGKSARRTEQHRVAVEAERRLIDIDPDDVAARRRHVAALRKAGTPEEIRSALAAWSAAAPDDPSVRHFLGAYNGRPDPRANDDYVRALFDGYAPRFDRHLAALGYRAPAAIADRLAELGVATVGTAVDLGCGTGQVGELIRPIARELIGVDLSAGMLEHARARAVFDELVESELTGYLVGQPRRFDLIASADTFIYVGDLRPVFAAARSALRTGGRLVFSVEAAAPGTTCGYRLEASGRYSHDHDYVADELRLAGFTDIGATTEVVRFERGVAVDGLVVAARG